jgi:hypothetical protein
VYLPHKLQEQVPILDAHPEVGVMYAATEYWYSWTGRPEDVARDWTWRKYGAKPDMVIVPPRLLVAFLEDGGTVPCMGSVLARRAAVERVGGWEESFQRICTDQVFHAKLCLAFPALIVDRCWDRYRQHEDSSCRTVARAGQTEAAFERYLTWLETYISEQRIDDPAVHASLQRALRPYRHPLLDRIGRRARHYNQQVKALASRGFRLRARSE